MRLIIRKWTRNVLFVSYVTVVIWDKEISASCFGLTHMDYEIISKLFFTFFL